MFKLLSKTRHITEYYLYVRSERGIEVIINQSQFQFRAEIRQIATIRGEKQIHAGRMINAQGVKVSTRQFNTFKEKLF
jgi:hypothetical protein